MSDMLRSLFVSTVTVACALATGCAAHSPRVIDSSFPAAKPQDAVKNENKSIRVRGIGANFDEALRNGFLLAAQQKIGAVVSSSRVVINNNLSVDEILDYSSGYVERYVIHSRNDFTNQSIVDMSVWILDSRIARRISGQTRSSDHIDGSSIAQSHNTYVRSLESADAQLKSVLRDFPQRSFQIKHENYRIRFDSERKPVLEIPYTISWNDNYVSALREALHYASLNKQKVPGKPFDPTVDNKLNRDFIFNYKSDEYHGRVVMDAQNYFMGSIFYIPDVEHYRTISNAFSQKRRPMLSVSYYNQSGQIMKGKMFCAEFDSMTKFMRPTSRRIELDTTETINYVFSVWLDEHTIRNLTRVVLSVSAAEDCSVVAKR